MHDFNPGPPAPGRPFWTLRLPARSGGVDPVAGTASYRLTDLGTRDYVFLANGLVGGPSAPSTVSFDLRWSGVTRRVSKVDRANRFAIDGAETGCSMVDGEAQRQRLHLHLRPGVEQAGVRGRLPRAQRRLLRRLVLAGAVATGPQYHSRHCGRA